MPEDNLPEIQTEQPEDLLAQHDNSADISTPLPTISQSQPTTPSVGLRILEYFLGMILAYIADFCIIFTAYAQLDYIHIAIRILVLLVALLINMGTVVLCFSTKHPGLAWGIITGAILSMLLIGAFAYFPL